MPTPTSSAVPSSASETLLPAQLATAFTPFAWTALRVVAGLLFAFHGMQKLFGWYAGYELPAAFSQLWVGGVIECVTGLLIAAGFFTRPAAFLASGTMAVAYIQFHWQFAFANGAWLPTQNQGELSLLYSFLFLFVCAAGAGRWSLDHLRSSAGRR